MTIQISPSRGARKEEERMENEGYKLSYGAYCKVHGAEIEIERAENEGRLEALFAQKFGTLVKAFEVFGKDADVIKRFYMKDEAQIFHEVFELLKKLKEDGVITLDYGKEMTIPEKYTPDIVFTDACSQPSKAGSFRTEPSGNVKTVTGNFMGLSGCRGQSTKTKDDSL